MELVCFDLGRVLIRICDGWQHACEVAGVRWTGGTLPAEKRARMMEAVKVLEVGGCGVAEFCAMAAPHLELSAREVEAIWNSYTRGPFDGAVELLDELRDAGVVTACLSNTNARHWEIMSADGDPHSQVLQRLDHRFASHLIAARKPDGPAYGHVERATGAAGSGIIFFDDMTENIEAAKARGWRGHFVERCENPIPWIRSVLCEAGYNISHR